MGNFRCTSSIAALRALVVTMGKTKALRNAVKERIFPLFEAKGLQRAKGRNPLVCEFKRLTHHEIWVVAIQWEKYGKPRFVVNFDKFPRTGIRWNSTDYSADEIDSSFAHCRLQPRSGTLTSSWFRQDRSLLASLMSGSRLRPEKEVVDELVSMIEEIFDYLGNDSVGNHIHTESRLTWTLPSDA